MDESEFEQPKVSETKKSFSQEEAEKDYAKFSGLKDAPNEHLLDWLFQASRDLDPRNTWIKPDALARLKESHAAMLRELRRRIEKGVVADVPAEVLTELMRVYPELRDA
ncbi:MAG: hypothetical protein HYW79_01330 [Parcubacteria group bacterium]|nr:hypothetical protein [Parcubacteria group bacterium]